MRRYEAICSLLNETGRLCSKETRTLAERLGQNPHILPIPLERFSRFSPHSPVMAPSQRVNPQDIIPVDAGANQHSFEASSLRDRYLTPSTDIVSSLKVYSTYCQEQLTTSQQQRDIYETIERRRTMNDEQIRDLSQMTRRDLFTLVSVSSSLLLNMRRGWPPAGVIEEFLSEVTASVTTCWYLLQRSDGLPTVELALPQYLPELVEVVKYSPYSRQRAAYLAAQGFLLRGLVAHHRVRYAKRVAYCQEAVTYARQSGDLTLLVSSLEHLSNALLTNGQLDESLHNYLQAKAYSESAQLSGLSRSLVRSGLRDSRIINYPGRLAENT